MSFFSIPRENGQILISKKAQKDSCPCLKKYQIISDPETKTVPSTPVEPLMPAFQSAFQPAALSKFL